MRCSPKTGSKRMSFGRHLGILIDYWAMQNQSPVAQYLTDVLGIQSFIRSGSPASIEVTAPAVSPAQKVETQKPKSKLVQFIIEHELSDDEQALIGRMMSALGAGYEVKTLEAAEDASIYLLWDATSKQKLGFSAEEQFVWKEQNQARYFLGCNLQELIGTNPEVATKKKQIWNELQCLKK